MILIITLDTILSPDPGNNQVRLRSTSKSSIDSSPTRDLPNEMQSKLIVESPNSNVFPYLL